MWITHKTVWAMVDETNCQSILIPVYDVMTVVADPREDCHGNWVVDVLWTDRHLVILANTFLDGDQVTRIECAV